MLLRVKYTVRSPGLLPVFLLAACLALPACSSEAPGVGASVSPAGDQAPAEKPLKVGSRKMTVTPLPAGVAHPSEIRPKAVELLSKVIQREAGKPGNAWALAHGILAFGPGFTASDGRLAVEVLADDFLEADRLPNSRGMQPYFPKTKGAVRVEPHTDLILKTFVEVGMPLDEPITDRAGAPTLKRLLRGSRLRFKAAEDASKGYFVDGDDIAWSIQGWCQAVDRGAEPTWRNSSGRTLDIEQIAMEQLKLLEREYHFIQRARAAGETVQKRRQDIFAHACGGAHLFQGVEACAAVGLPSDENLRSRFLQLVDAYLWRIPFEIQLVDRAIKGSPRLVPILVNQDIKFLGHALEALGKAEANGLWHPNPAEVEQLARMEERLLMHVLQLGSIKVYDAEKMASLFAREHGFQFYLDLVGDACPAYVGLKLQEELKGRRGRDAQERD